MCIRDSAYLVNSFLFNKVLSTPLILVHCSDSIWGYIWPTAYCLRWCWAHRLHLNQMEVAIVRCAPWPTRPSRRPNETQVSLNADSGDNETKFHFNVLGSSGSVAKWWREYRRACRDNEWCVGVNLVFCCRLKYKLLLALAHGARSSDWISIFSRICFASRFLTLNR